MFWDKLSVPHSRVKQSKQKTLEDGTNRLTRNIGKYQSTLSYTPEKRIAHLHRGGSLKLPLLDTFKRDSQLSNIYTAGFFQKKHFLHYEEDPFNAAYCEKCKKMRNIFCKQTAAF